eukprot:4219716-Lingulodinium_polyedra.AAC.1
MQQGQEAFAEHRSPELVAMHPGHPPGEVQHLLGVACLVHSFWLPLLCCNPAKEGLQQRAGLSSCGPVVSCCLLGLVPPTGPFVRAIVGGEDHPPEEDGRPSPCPGYPVLQVVPHPVAWVEEGDQPEPGTVEGPLGRAPTVTPLVQADTERLACVLKGLCWLLPGLGG